MQALLPHKGLWRLLQCAVSCPDIWEGPVLCAALEIPCLAVIKLQVAALAWNTGTKL